MTGGTLKPFCTLNPSGFYRIKEYIPEDKHALFADCLYDIGFSVEGPRTGEKPRRKLNVSKRKFLTILTSFDDDACFPQGGDALRSALIRAFEEVYHFSLNAKTPPEKKGVSTVVKRKIIHQYEKYQKPRLERLKIVYPDVPLYILIAGGKRIQEYLKKRIKNE